MRLTSAAREEREKEDERPRIMYTVGLNEHVCPRKIIGFRSRHLPSLCVWLPSSLCLFLLGFQMFVCTLIQPRAIAGRQRRHLDRFERAISTLLLTGSDGAPSATSLYRGGGCGVGNAGWGDRHKRERETQCTCESVVDFMRDIEYPLAHPPPPK